MPQATLSARRLQARLSRPVTPEELETLLFASKLEMKDWTEDTLVVEGTPDRLDLLCESGLALYLDGRRGDATGLPPFRTRPANVEAHIEVDPSVRPLRPLIAAVALTPPRGGKVDEGLLEEVVRFQELIHATVGQGRRLASLGVYPLARLRPPFFYRAEPLAEVHFVPLDGDAELPASHFYAEHPLALRYGEFGKAGERCLTLRDANEQVLSLPPVLNSRTAGELRVGDRSVLLESTGTISARVVDSLGLLLLPFVAAGWTPGAVPVNYPDRSDPGTDGIALRRLVISHELIRDVLGVQLPSVEIRHLLEQSRLRALGRGNTIWADAPPWRPDLLGPVDLVEEVATARGLHVEEARVPPSPTRGGRRPESWFRQRVGALLLGLGFTHLHTTVLVSGSATRRLGRTEALALTNPVSEELSHLRDRLQTSLLIALGRNVRHGYPQRFAEVGPVIIRDAGAETGAATRYHAAAFLAHDRAGFSDSAAVVDYLLRAFGARGVREPAALPGTIPGRSARVRIAGESVAEIGEIAPQVLEELHVPVPVAWAEVDLSSLFPLVRRPETV